MKKSSLKSFRIEQNVSRIEQNVTIPGTAGIFMSVKDVRKRGKQRKNIFLLSATVHSHLNNLKQFVSRAGSSVTRSPVLNIALLQQTNIRT